MLLWLMNMGFAGGGGDDPEPPQTVAPGGVKRRPSFKLADMQSREELERFIRSHVEIKPSPQPQADAPVPKAGKKGKKQREDEELAELAMRNMQREAEEELRIEYNNQVLILLIMAAIDDE